MAKFQTNMSGFKKVNPAKINVWKNISKSKYCKKPIKCKSMPMSDLYLNIYLKILNY